MCITAWTRSTRDVPQMIHISVIQNRVCTMQKKKKNSETDKYYHVMLFDRQFTHAWFMLSFGPFFWFAVYGQNFKILYFFGPAPYNLANIPSHSQHHLFNNHCSNYMYSFYKSFSSWWIVKASKKWERI